MERRDQGANADDAAPAGDAAEQTAAPAARGVKREPGAAGQQTAATEENWSALSNLRVGEEATNRHKVRRTSSSAHPTTPQDDGAFSKSSLSFILGDQAASAAAAGTRGVLASFVSRCRH
jgi:hypothetical protein